jgi:hypothetical protein
LFPEFDDRMQAVGFGLLAASAASILRRTPASVSCGRVAHGIFEGKFMSEVVYVSNVQIERKAGPLRIAHLPGEAQPVIFSVHGAIAAHYKVPPESIRESHAATIDYVIAGTAG